MGEFLHQLASGLALGGVYAIMALALVMIYQATHLINFAQGEMAMFSTYFAWKLMDLGEPYWFAFFATVVASFIGGVVIERLVVRPFANAPILASVIVFIGLSLIFNSLAGWLYGFSVTSFDSPFTGRPWFGAGYMSSHEAGSVLVTLCVLALVYAFFRLTPLGLAMRAAAQNPVSSRLVGIRVGWMLAIGWGLAAAIGSVAGMMAAPIVYLDPNMMGGVLLYAFAGAVLGGIDNPFGAVFGGIAVGVLGNLIGAYRRRRRGQAVGRAGDHHRRIGVAAVRTVRAPPRGEGVTMADADRALGALVAIAVGVFALAFPFIASGYHIYQGAQVLILAIALLGLNLLTGYNGQISLGHGAFFAIGGYGAAILMVKFGLPYWLAIPLASVVCFVAGFLFGFPALRSAAFISRSPPSRSPSLRRRS